MIDRKKIAKARDKFFMDHPGIDGGPVNYPYLRNRLEKAFIAGVHFAENAKDDPAAPGTGRQPVSPPDALADDQRRVHAIRPGTGKRLHMARPGGFLRVLHDRRPHSFPAARRKTGRGKVLKNRV